MYAFAVNVLYIFRKKKKVALELGNLVQRQNRSDAFNYFLYLAEYLYIQNNDLLHESVNLKPTHGVEVHKFYIRMAEIIKDEQDILLYWLKNPDFTKSSKGDLITAWINNVESFQNFSAILNADIKLFYNLIYSLMQKGFFEPTKELKIWRKKIRKEEILNSVVSRNAALIRNLAEQGKKSGLFGKDEFETLESLAALIEKKDFFIHRKLKYAVMAKIFERDDLEKLRFLFYNILFNDLVNSLAEGNFEKVKELLRMAKLEDFVSDEGKYFLNQVVSMIEAGNFDDAFGALDFERTSSNSPPISGRLIVEILQIVKAFKSRKV